MNNVTPAAHQSPCPSQMDLQVRPVDQLKDTVDLAHSEQNNKKVSQSITNSVSVIASVIYVYIYRLA